MPLASDPKLSSARPARRRRIETVETEWLEIVVEAEREAVESVSELFARLGTGVAIHEPVQSSRDGEEVTIDPAATVRVVTHIPLDATTEQRRLAIEDGLWHLAQLRQVRTPTVQTVSDRDWADAWKRYFSVHRIGQRVVIVPSWRRYKSLPDDVIIRLDPGMAFGTGLHPTTRLCTEALETTIKGGESVLDLGCGSGILSIAAAKLGVASVVGVDIETIAAQVANENARRNRVARVVKTVEGTLDTVRDRAPFDLVVANISFRVLSVLPAELHSVTKPRGRAILSGVLEDRADELIELWEHAGWRCLDRKHEADWAAIQFSRG
ncbi:MAG: 50S ribosomal protein L11 methyltransferase [Chloroflexota bacterium]